MGFYEEINAIAQESWQKDKKRVKKEMIKTLLYFVVFLAIVILIYTY